MFARIFNGQYVGLFYDESSQNYHDISSIVADINADSLPILAQLSKHDFIKCPKYNLTEADFHHKITSCLGGVGKFIAIGLNYADHAAEAGMAIPSEPIIFTKATSSICGAFDNIEIPPDSTACDWEVELGVVIGKQAKNISESQALNHVFGYCAVNDISERDWQTKRLGQWVKGKSYDSFGPIGPYLVPKDKIANVQNCQLWCKVNGEIRQMGNTKTMIFNVAQLVSYVSQFMTLKCGDIITTGTPPGVGMGMKPEPQYLKRGDILECGVEFCGSQRHICV